MHIQRLYDCLSENVYTNKTCTANETKSKFRTNKNEQIESHKTVPYTKKLKAFHVYVFLMMLYTFITITTTTLFHSIQYDSYYCTIQIHCGCVHCALFLSYFVPRQSQSSEPAAIMIFTVYTHYVRRSSNFRFHFNFNFGC